jgi:hypothetical protein
MSEIREITSVRRLRNAGTVTCHLACNQGDAYQEYGGKDSNGNDIAKPDWTNNDANRPIWTPYISAAINKGNVQIIPTDDQWTYNTTKLTFGTDGLSNNAGLVGVFRRITIDGIPSLKAMKNLASEANQDSDTLKFDGAVKVGKIDDRVQKTVPITIIRKSESSYKGVIQGADGNNLVITEAGGSVKLYAKLLLGGESVANGSYTVDWKKQENGVFVDITDDAGNKITDNATHIVTLKADMVNAFLNVYAIFKDFPSGVELTSDVGTVQDLSDPLRIRKNAVPEDEIIEQDTDTVVYTPAVVDSDGNVRSEFTHKFKFFLSNEAGVKIVGDYNHSTVATASQTITANDVEKAAPGELIIEIIGNDEY